MFVQSYYVKLCDDMEITVSESSCALKTFNYIKGLISMHIVEYAG